MEFAGTDEGVQQPQVITRMSTDRFFAIDRIDGLRITLVGDDGRRFTVSPTTLSGGVREGLVLRVPLLANAEPDWSRARVDQQETDRRLADARRRLNKLKERDPGGDVVT